MPSESERVPAALRRTVASTAKNLCEYCRCPEEFSPDSFTVEHIKPRQAGGEAIAENLAWSCFGCNGRKHTKTTLFKGDARGISIDSNEANKVGKHALEHWFITYS